MSASDVPLSFRVRCERPMTHTTSRALVPDGTGALIVTSPSVCSHQKLAHRPPLYGTPNCSDRWLDDLAPAACATATPMSAAAAEPAAALVIWVADDADEGAPGALGGAVGAPGAVGSVGAVVGAAGVPGAASAASLAGVGAG